MHVLHVISTVHANDIEHTLLSLTFSDALKLISYMKEWASNIDKVELVCRIATVPLQTHHNQLISTSASKPILAALRSILYKSIKDCKDTLGFNLAAMEHIMEIMSMNSDAPFRDAKAKLMEIRSRQTKRQEEYAEVKDKRKSKKEEDFC